MAPARMTLTELARGLPHAFHDADLVAIDVDYRTSATRLHMRVCVVDSRRMASGNAPVTRAREIRIGDFQDVTVPAPVDASARDAETR